MFVDIRSIANDMQRELVDKLDKLPKKRVAFVSLLDDPAARSFLKRKTEIAKRLYIDTEVVHEWPIDTDGYDGVVIQLPLPDNLNVEECLSSIPPELDIDMLGAKAKEAYKSGTTKRMPPVARAAREILERSEADHKGKKILVLGKGRLVGKPVSEMLTRMGIMFEAVDETTPEERVSELLHVADVVISGVGKPHFVKPLMVKPGALLIDAGTNGEEGKIMGDVDPACAEVCLVTPVPGGVGPLAVLSLFYNLTEEL